MTRGVYNSFRKAMQKCHMFHYYTENWQWFSYLLRGLDNLAIRTVFAELKILSINNYNCDFGLNRFSSKAIETAVLQNWSSKFHQNSSIYTYKREKIRTENSACKKQREEKPDALSKSKAINQHKAESNFLENHTPNHRTRCTVRPIRSTSISFLFLISFSCTSNPSQPPSTPNIFINQPKERKKNPSIKLDNNLIFQWRKKKTKTKIKATTISTLYSTNSCDFSNSRHGFNSLRRGKPSGEVPQWILIVIFTEPIFEIQRITQRVVPKLSRGVSFMLTASIPATAENCHALVFNIAFQIMGRSCFQPK